MYVEECKEIENHDMRGKIKCTNCLRFRKRHLTPVVRSRLVEVLTQFVNILVDWMSGTALVAGALVRN